MGPLVCFGSSRFRLEVSTATLDRSDSGKIGVKLVRRRDLLQGQRLCESLKTGISEFCGGIYYGVEHCIANAS